MQDADLWNRIVDHSFDAPEAELTFAGKLAESAGWSPVFTRKAISEYLRFVYLTQLRLGAVTPSVAVDRVWHAHLTHTRNYWDEFCAKTLGRVLHHDPGTKSSDAARHAEQYRRTHALYEREFGAAPPADIWPRPVGEAPARKGVGKERFAGFALLAAVGLGLGALYAGGETGIYLGLGAGLSVMVGLALSGAIKSDRKNSSCGAGCSASHGSCRSDCGGGD